MKDVLRKSTQGEVIVWKLGRIDVAVGLCSKLIANESVGTPLPWAKIEV